MDEKRCCMAIVDGIASAGRARLALQRIGTLELLISMLRKPLDQDSGVAVHRISAVGAVICDGPLAGRLGAVADLPLPLPDRQSLGNRGIGDFRILLDDLAVPQDRHATYEEALKGGHVLIILQGTEDALRGACDALRPLAVHEPILYFG